MHSKVLQWLSLVGIIWLQSINGTNFDFPSYSSELKQLLSMSQLQLNNLAFASDAGKLFGWLSGIAAVYLPLWLVLVIGSTLGFVGYGIQYLFITNQIHSLSYWHIFLLTVIAGNSICWINTVCYIVAIRNFPLNRQVAVGISTSYQGLSAKIYTGFVDSMISGFSSKTRAKTFLLLNSTLPLIVCLIASPLARDIKVGVESKNMEVGFVVIFVITMATGVFAILTSIGPISSKLSPLSVLVGITVFLFLPLVIPLVEKVKEMYVNKEGRRVYDFTGEENGEISERIREGNINNEMTKIEREEGLGLDDGVSVMEEIGVKSMVKRVNFWLYLFVYLFGATLGLVFLNNLGQIAESRQSSNNISSLVSLSSSFGFFGRLMPSLLDHFFSRRSIRSIRPAMVVVLMGAMCGGFLLLLNPTNLWLYGSTGIIAVSTGAIISISVSTTTELFGIKNFSINHNVVVANIPFGSFLFGSIAAFFYHKQAAVSHAGVNVDVGADAGHGISKCIGVECYKITFLMWGSFCFLGTLLAAVLFVRTKNFYSRKLQMREKIQCNT